MEYEDKRYYGVAQICQKGHVITLDYNYEKNNREIR